MVTVNVGACGSPSCVQHQLGTSFSCWHLWLNRANAPTRTGVFGKVDVFVWFVDEGCEEGLL